VSSTPITGASLGTPIRYNTQTGQEVRGDVCDAAWADDDCLYAAVDDSWGWLGESGRNLLIACLEGATPPDVRAGLVNPMTTYEAAQ
jgi:hypothetical protein